MLTGGRAYVGQRSVNPLPPDDYVWEDLTDNDLPPGVAVDFPATACAISISPQGNDTWVKVVTTAGAIWETHGDTNGNDFDWDEGWSPLAALPLPPNP